MLDRDINSVQNPDILQLEVDVAQTSFSYRFRDENIRCLVIDGFGIEKPVEMEKEFGFSAANVKCCTGREGSFACPSRNSFF